MSRSLNLTTSSRDQSSFATEDLGDISPAEIELSEWMTGVGKCNLSQLKSLCRANNLMVSGAKSEVFVRLIRFKRHGSPGVYRCCNKSELKFG